MIPYTPSLLEEFRRGITPWLAGLYLEHPSLLLGKSYWQVSPVGTPGSLTSGGIPIGFGEDSEYFGRYRGALVRATLAVPEQVAGISDMEAFRFETLRHLLACRNLRFISIWNPSFLTLLLRELRSLAGALIPRIGADGLVRRAAELQGIFDAYKGAKFDLRDSRGRTLGEAICASSGSSVAGPMPRRTRRLSSPGRIPERDHPAEGPDRGRRYDGLPWRADGAALAIRSHFFEFLEAGRTTRSCSRSRNRSKLFHCHDDFRGIVSYRIGDLVEVTGRIAQCPLLRFCGRESDVADMAGEKLNGLHVVRAAEQVFGRFGSFRVLDGGAGERRPGALLTLYVKSKSAAPEGLVSALILPWERIFTTRTPGGLANSPR